MLEDWYPDLFLDTCLAGENAVGDVFVQEQETAGAEPTQGRPEAVIDVTSPTGERTWAKRSSVASVEASIIKDRKAAVQEAKAYASDRQPRVMSKPGKPEYEKLEGQKYPLSCPVFDPEKPCIADLGIGVSLYFTTLKRLMVVFFLMFLLGIPSLTITFMANPNVSFLHSWQGLFGRNEITE